jgi:hypothetical protein
MVDAEGGGDGVDFPVFPKINPANVGVLFGRDQRRERHDERIPDFGRSRVKADTADASSSPLTCLVEMNPQVPMRSVNSRAHRD